MSGKLVIQKNYTYSFWVDVPKEIGYGVRRISRAVQIDHLAWGVAGLLAGDVGIVSWDSWGRR